MQEELGVSGGAGRIEGARKSQGWSLSALLLGPFYYLAHGAWVKGIVLLGICVITFGFAVPIVWLYCGWRGAGEVYDRKLSGRSRIDPDRL